MLTINRYCHSLKILHFLRSHFSLINNSLPIILHEITTDEEIILTNEMIQSIPINTGIYLALIKYDYMKYQPLIDLKLIPIEIFPEKKFLPKSMPFIIYEISSFVKTLTNMIDYMKEYEKTKIMCQISTINRTSLSSPDSSIIPVNVDIRKYIVTDPTRINNNSLPFHFRVLNQDERIFQLQTADSVIPFSSIMNLSG
jgi:hypothetical protein